MTRFSNLYNNFDKTLTRGFNQICQLWETELKYQYKEKEI